MCIEQSNASENPSTQSKIQSSIRKYHPQSIQFLCNMDNKHTQTYGDEHTPSAHMERLDNSTHIPKQRFNVNVGKQKGNERLGKRTSECVRCCDCGSVFTQLRCLARLAANANVSANLLTHAMVFVRQRDTISPV